MQIRGLAVLLAGITLVLRTVAQPAPNLPIASVTAEATHAFDAPDPQPGSSSQSGGWDVAIYPLLGWLPIFGANVDLPDIEIPGDGVSPGGSGTTSTSFNGAALFGATVIKKEWILDISALWAGLSAERTNPIVKVKTNVVYGDLLAGRQLYRHLALMGGFRRMALNIGAQVGNRPEISRKPGVWDPLVGIDWHGQLGRKWSGQLILAGGGFGVGSDVDISGEARADWRFARHFGLTMGYKVVHFQISDTVLRQTFKTNQTFNGPIIGFGIYI